MSDLVLPLVRQVVLSRHRGTLNEETIDTFYLPNWGEKPSPTIDGLHIIVRIPSRRTATLEIDHPNHLLTQSEFSRQTKALQSYADLV